MGVIRTKGPAVVTKRQTVATPYFWQKQLLDVKPNCCPWPWWRSWGFWKAMLWCSARPCGAPQSMGWGLSPFKACLRAELSNAPSTKKFWQRLERCLAEGRLQRAPKILGASFGHSCRQALAWDFGTSLGRQFRTSICILYFILVFRFPFELQWHLYATMRPHNTFFLLV